MSKFSYSSNIVESTVEGSLYKSKDGATEFARTTRTYSTTAHERASNHNGYKIITNFFTIFLVIILISTIFSVMTGSNHELTFTGFLDWLHNYEPIVPNVTYVAHTVESSWGILDFLRTVVNWFITVGDFLVWTFQNMVNLIGYMGGFIQFLFA